MDERKDLISTTTKDATNREPDERTGRHWDELKKVQEGMMRALKEKDEQMRKELEEDKRRLREWMDKAKKDSEGMAAIHAAEKERTEARVVEMGQGARKDRLWVEAELTSLSRRLLDTTSASAADQARLEKEVKEERKRTEAELANLSSRLQDAINASAADRAKLEQEVKAREQADAERKQLADLARRLQDEIAVSVAHRARLEQEMKKLQDRVAIAATMPPPVPPRPTLYVQVLLCSDTHDV